MLEEFGAGFAFFLTNGSHYWYRSEQKGIEKDVIDSVRKYNLKIIINCVVISEVAGISIRDWAPILAIDDKGKTVGWKLVYQPRYLVGNK